MKKRKVTITVDEKTYRYLELLGGNPAAPSVRPGDVMAYLAQCVADGIRRPGAWERGWVQQAFDVSTLERRLFAAVERDEMMVTEHGQYVFLDKA